MIEDKTNLPVSSVTHFKEGSAGRKPDNISRGKPRISTNEHKVLPFYRNHSSNDGSISRRLSTGTVEKGQDILPHYLRASAGSCHDLCKYGRKHSFEEESKYPLSKRTNKPPADEPIKLTMVKRPSLPKTLEGVVARSRRNSDVSLRKEKMVPKASVIKYLKSQAGSSAPLKNQNKIQKDGTNKFNAVKVSKKTMHVINLETEKNLLEPEQDGNIMLSLQLPSISFPESLSKPHSPLLSNDEEKEEEIDCVEDEHTSCEALTTADIETVGKSQKKILSKGKAGVSEYNDTSVVKLKFKRGKVIDGNESCTNPKSGKVVLRHQDLQEKKDAQVLLNDVIEETASKLVESKKSKVKALVGAFETVISLQENKPSALIVS
ncbi:uncharacterized protein [Nicotiana sylvestris]|uniref:Uncharacterized protein LOC104237824 n=1 Tax=Nicotiana sylvestris TaxID=4096 RepID=A0A1U7XTX4_NICSY|nr:PREDICTED: uncharacterized protein LOC104237824 [Nicotiana sylvestris]XP_009790354.1 PREDICTED: uncharacterized protein LOC104237824 [Nicotiana sylvestris]